MDLAEKESLIEDEERRMVHSVFQLGDTLVREVMVPRTDLVSVERFKTQTKIHQLITDFPPDFPTIPGDETRLRQVIDYRRKT